ncbi:MULTISPECIES: ABC transporter ATP-binding protein [unclassified Psychrobacillus]|uniref:ABC transporter ATP-binding protein n=1 Tax=unclassified Psychrobacillus TaxID=2636677 RepID=UPI00146B94DF|nr:MULTISPECIES: ABC transporter ATP-binding protein [unclassified Psychrobacillus]MCM3357885.1 ABC transporter ATP-binding protein/permease [Psychrobacillus sp. MER TA 171]NME05256.1 ABC transporter ATP-binding protein [Psychrobacillus sp. BL-248-WT-3]
MSFIRKPFGYEPVITKEDLKKNNKKKVEKVSDWKGVLSRLWKLVDEQRFLLIVVLLLVVVSSALSLLGPYLVGRIIDEYITVSVFEGLARLIGILIVVYIFLSISMYLQSYWMIGVAQQTIYRLRTILFNKLQKLPVSFFDKRQHGELMSRMTNDIENVSQTLNSSFIQVFSSLLTLVGTTVVMLMLSPLLTLVTLIIVPVMFFAMKWITKRTSKLFKEQQQAVGELNGMIEETISGQRIVKAFSQEQRMLEDFALKSERLKRTGFWALTYSGFIPKVMNLLNNTSFTLVAAAGGVLAYHGYVSIGEIVIFTEYARQFTRPLNDLANQFNTVLSAIAGAERVFAIIDEPEEQDTVMENKDLKLKGNVTFENVTFKYNTKDEKPTIEKVSFHVEAGKTAALVGATGAGKTTIMQLLARFYETNEGKIIIDGIAIDQMPRYTLRSQTAFVLQDPFLFEMSVKENIRYGKLNATDEEIIQAAKEANAHEFIAKLPNGYDTILSADGGEISQGQKQLLSIARALVADPAILLLDEATSSIDTVTELKIQEALERLMEGRTSFVIAHRLNTVRKADLIFVMENGKLIESGSQEDLINAQGRFYSMLMNSKI